MTGDIEHLFKCLFAITCTLQQKCSNLLLIVLECLGFLLLLLRFDSSVYILDTSLLFDMFYRYFLSACTCLFILIISSNEQKLVIWIKFNLSVWVFLNCAFNVILKNSLPNPRS